MPSRQPVLLQVRLARKAGLLYLVIAIFGAFAQVVRVRVYAPGDAATTTANLIANASLVRLSFAADLLQALVWLCLALVLHRLFAHAGTYLARAMVIFVVFSAGIASLNMVHQLGALLVATTPAYTAAFGTAGSQGMALLLMDIQHYGYLIAQLSWLWLFTLGLLGYRSGLFPPLALVLVFSATFFFHGQMAFSVGAPVTVSPMLIPVKVSAEYSSSSAPASKASGSTRPTPTARPSSSMNRTRHGKLKRQ